MTSLRSLALTAVAVLAVHGVSQGQSRSLFGSSGPTGGQSSLGSSSSLGSTSRSTSSLGGTSLSSGLSGSANSRLGTGSNATATSGLTNQLQSLNIGGADIQLSGQSGFVGRSDNTGRFVGNSQAGQQQSGGRGGQQGGGQFNFGGNNGQGGLNALMNGLNGGQFGAQQGGNARRGTLRPQQKISFSFTPKTTPEASAALNTRFKTLSGNAALRGITVIPQTDGFVVLRGTVSDDEARKLAAAIVRLEPGVRTVQNEITVAP